MGSARRPLCGIPRTPRGWVSVSLAGSALIDAPWAMRTAPQSRRLRRSNELLVQIDHLVPDLEAPSLPEAVTRRRATSGADFPSSPV